MKTIYKLFCTLFLLICFLISHAQTEKITKELREADNKYFAKNYTEAGKIYLEHSALLTPIQQFNLAICYYNVGGNNPESHTAAMKLLILSADRGHTEAMTTIAYCYETGLGVKKDSVQQLAWVKKAADYGDANAMVSLGYYFQKGWAVPKDIQKAKELYTKALEKGNINAGYFFGLMEREAGNSTNAYHYMEKSASKGFAPAQLELGKMYEEGFGTGKKDLDEANRWYHKIKYSAQYANYYTEANGRIRSFGMDEPSTDLQKVKPLLLKLVSRANESFYDLKGRIIDPYNKSPYDNLGSSKNEYYTSLLDLGFKNAYIRKNNFDQIQKNNSIKKVDNFIYNAEIIHSSGGENTYRVYTKWASILKSIFTGWNLSEENFAHQKTGTTTLYQHHSNGRTTIIVLKTCCPNDKVEIVIKNNHNPQ